MARHPATLLAAALLLRVLPIAAQEAAPLAAPAAMPPPVATAAPAAAPAAAPEVTPERLHAELRALRDAMLAAIERGDIEVVLLNLHPNVVFTPLNGEVCRGPAEVRRYFEKMMTGPERVVEKLELGLEVAALTDLYGDTGLAYGTSHDTYHLRGGASFAIDSKWTCSLVRHDGRWLITSFHASANAFDNPILTAAVRAASLRVGAIAAALP